MREDHIEKLTKKLGTADAPTFIEKINLLDVGNDIQFLENGISIPKATISDVPALQSDLSLLSKAGRAFEISEEGDRLIINTTKLKSSFLRENQFWSNSMGEIKPMGSPMHTFKTIKYNTNTNPWGVKEEDVQLPEIPRGSKVLDVGAGTGFISQKIRNTYNCDVYALEPSFESSTDYDSCVNRLGMNRVEKLTLPCDG